LRPFGLLHSTASNALSIQCFGKYLSCLLQNGYVVGVQFATYCQPYLTIPNSPHNCTFALKMSTVISAETMDNFQHCTLIISRSRSYTTNSSNKNLRSGKEQLVSSVLGS
jgi:hypothetical protein